jgi:hypothetical protein
MRAGSPVHSAPTSERLARLQQLVALSGNGLAVEIEMTEFEAGGPPEERGPQLPEYAGARDGAFPPHDPPCLACGTACNPGGTPFPPGLPHHHHGPGEAPARALSFPQDVACRWGLY